MNRVTQQNAANAEESAAAAEELNSQAAELKSTVIQYKLSNGGASNKSYGPLHVTGERNKRTTQIQNKPHKAIEVKPDKFLPLDGLDDDDFNDF